MIINWVEPGSERKGRGARNKQQFCICLEYSPSVITTLTPGVSFSVFLICWIFAGSLLVSPLLFF